ncbi:MAG: 2-oxoacid:acceptor oxidoreductase subunit alpha [Fibrobacterota bacterium]
MKPNCTEKPHTVKILLRGEAGDGILSGGELLLNAAAQTGFSSSVHKNFPPTIRGGYCSSLVTITNAGRWSPCSEPDISVSISDARLCISPDKEIPLPLNAHFRSKTQNPLKTSFALGVLCSILGIAQDLILELLGDKLKGKSPELLEQNRSVFQKGCSFARESIVPLPRYLLPDCSPPPEQRVILDGNQAVALGAVAAGCKLYASYPITPATSIGDHLSLHLPPRGGFSYQAEDETAALGAVIGASFSGSRAMTATSGPGLSLMQELIGYSSMTELPAVIVDVQRAGPSTGMPTKHSQDDLFAAALGGHGEDQRIILGATSVKDCFYLTMEAFNLADQYQCPVILLSDSALANLKSTLKRPDPARVPPVARRVCLEQEGSSENYRRFDPDSGQSRPVPVPGVSPASYRVTGVEHDEYFVPANCPRNRSLQMQRREEKLLDLFTETAHLQEWDTGGIELGEADISVVSWGLSASVTKQAVGSLRNRGMKVAAFYPRLLYPVDRESYLTLSRFSASMAVVESNSSGQLSSLIRMATGLEIHSITQSRGEPFTSEEITENLYQFYKERIIV